MFYRWLRQLARVVGGSRLRGTTFRRRKPVPQALRLEALENRIVPATVLWTGSSADGSDPTHVHWQDQSNGTFHNPGAADDAVINTAVTVTHSTGSDTVNSLKFGASGVASSV